MDAVRVSYLRFNVSGLPAGAVVTKAELKATAANGSTETGGTIRGFAPSTAAWAETQPTWNSPLAGNDASSDLATLGPVAVGTRYTFGNLASMVPGNGQVTFVIRSAALDGASYHSRESATTSARPVLEVTYTT